MTAFSAANLKVVGSSPANASLFPGMSILDVQLRALSAVEPGHIMALRCTKVNKCSILYLV